MHESCEASAVATRSSFSFRSAVARSGSRCFVAPEALNPEAVDLARDRCVSALLPSSGRRSGRPALWAECDRALGAERSDDLVAEPNRGAPGEAPCRSGAMGHSIWLMLVSGIAGELPHLSFNRRPQEISI